jgi:FkbM family methyltransferase
MTLTRKSAHVHLSSLGFQSGKQKGESIEFALECLGDAFKSGIFEDVYRSEVALARGDGTTAHIRLSSANTQLHGLNDQTEEFKYGYEPEIAAVIDFFVPNDGAMIDVGANFGYFPLFLASRPGFVGVIHAFEPSTRGFTDLQVLVSNSGLSERIHMHKLALGDSSGVVNLLLSKSDGLSTTIASMANKLEKVLGQETVGLRRLDEFALQSVGLIKIDVEGAETQVIAGAIDTLQATKAIVIFESWTSVDDSRAFSMLEDCGYLFFVPGWRNANGHVTLSLAQAADRSLLILPAFKPENRKNLPQRINVVAIPQDRLNALPALILSR